MVSAITYTVEATRTGTWWSLQCVEVPGALSQVKSLAEGKRIMPEAIAFVAGVPESDVEVIVTPVVPEAVRAHLDEASRLRAEAARANSESAIESRLAAQLLRETGMTVRDIGKTLGMSYQRAGQLISTGE